MNESKREDDPRDKDPVAVEALRNLEQALAANDAVAATKAVDRLVKLRINQWIDSVVKDFEASRQKGAGTS